MHKTYEAIILLVAIHVIAGLVLASFLGPIPDNVLAPAYFGLVGSQLSLLGIWGGLGTNKWPVRLFGIMIALGAYVAPLFSSAAAGEELLETIYIMASSTFVISLVFSFIRRRVASIQRNNEDNIPMNPSTWQFSIRQLMLLTFFVAVVLTLGKWFSAYLPTLEIISISIVVTLFLVPLGLACVWAMLGKSHLLMRCILVMLIAAALGSIPRFFSQNMNYWFALSVILEIVGFTLASLWVIRWCGFRMVRVTRVQPPHASTACASIRADRE